jgi:hypothetical protein
MTPALVGAEREGILNTLLKYSLVMIAAIACLPMAALSAGPTDEDISRALKNPENREIIEGFLKAELSEVNEYAAKPLLGKHPSLKFFIKQAQSGPLKSLLFLEEQVDKLKDAQENINSLPYVITFTPSEKKKILGLREETEEIISYGIPKMKRDFYTVLQAAKKLSARQKVSPLDAVGDHRYRDEMYRMAAPTPEILSAEMGKLSHGEKVCIRLGWVLEQVTVTKLWLMVNDNRLPTPEDYAAFRKKRSEYFQRRLKRIYGKN